MGNTHDNRQKPMKVHNLDNEENMRIHFYRGIFILLVLKDY